MILNRKFPTEYNNNNGPVLNNEKLEIIIRNAIVPRTPEDKINSLLTFIHSLQVFEGSTINWPGIGDRLDLAKRLYFKNYQELVFYLFTLLQKGLIIGRDASTMDGADLIDIRLTYEGLAKVIEINESGAQSNRCFVAMSFSNSQKDTRDAIRKAINNCKFDAILIDELHINSDVTINDALIAEIRKAKFVVSDFTEHKHGVYFEAGFALGLGKPVIYLCDKKDFDNSHFDTNHYPHIRYESLEELIEKLQTKIEAWIK
ncbi:MAG: nucleoside 2-deoxyribosyltransferase [Crocinitomicaceae bacterium]|jgi:nucleoside 2-deoxyribosyltransferase